MQHILVVDDDALMLSLLARALPDYRLTVARDPSEALALASRALPDWWHSEAHLSKPFRVDALREAVINLIGLPRQ